MKLLSIAALVLLATSVTGLADAAANALRPRDLTPAERKIQWARAAIAADPTDARFHNELGLALARRARETANPEFYSEAQAALDESLRIAPGNFEARKLRVWTLLGQHEFPLALVHARELNRLIPDDVALYGFMADALVELGRTDEAEEAVNWMLRLRPGNVAGMTRAAYLRELFGDVEGALDLMLKAVHSIDPAESEDRAWALTHAAHLELSRGRVESAEYFLDEALKAFPEYHYALAQMADVRRAQGRHADAVELLEKRAQAAPHPENFAELAWALQRKGDTERAAELLAKFESGAEQESKSWDNANRELILHWTQSDRASEALDLARMEIARRQDVYTLDTYAWALFANEMYDEARAQIEDALKVGTCDARILEHAGAIAFAQGDPDAARDYLERSLQANPHSTVATDARELLRELEQAAE